MAPQQELKQEIQRLKKELRQSRQAEEQLRRQTRRNELVLQTAMDGFFITDVDARIIEANKAASLLTGYTQKELIGNGLRSFVIELTRGQIAQIMDLTRKKKKPHRTEMKFRCKDGHIADHEVSIEFINIGKDRAFFSFFRDISERKGAERALKEREQELEIKTRSLEEANAALRVLLKRREEDKKELEEKMLLNVRELVMPYVQRLTRSELDVKQKAYVELLQSNLQDIISPFTHTLSSKYAGLTPTKIQVANLVKEGKTTKEIAELLNVAPSTVKSHREHIRSKMGITSLKANLRSHLLTLH